MSAVKVHYETRIVAITSFLAQIRVQIVQAKHFPNLTDNPLPLHELLAIERRENAALAEAVNYVAAINNALAGCPTASPIQFTAPIYKPIHIYGGIDDDDEMTDEDDLGCSNDDSMDEDDDVFHDAVEAQPEAVMSDDAEDIQHVQPSIPTSPVSPAAAAGPTEAEKHQFFAETVRRTNLETIAERKRQRAAGKAYQDECAVVIAGAPKSLTRDDVVAAFHPLRIVDILVPAGKKTKGPSGNTLSSATTSLDNAIVLVVLDSHGSALCAVDRLNNTNILGKTVRVHMKNVRVGPAKRTLSDGPEPEINEHYAKFLMAREADREECEAETGFVPRPPRSTLRPRSNHADLGPSFSVLKEKRAIEATLFAHYHVPGVTADARPSPSKRVCTDKVPYEKRQVRIEGDGETVRWGKRLRK